MRVIVDYFQLSQMKSCRKVPQRSRNHLLRQRTNSFYIIQNASYNKKNISFIHEGDRVPKVKLQNRIYAEYIYLFKTFIVMLINKLNFAIGI